MRFAILGAGGVGGYYGALLARAGHAVVLLARGEHLDAIRSRGMEVRAPDGSFAVPIDATDNPAALGRPDCVVIAVKNYSLPEVAPIAAGLARGGANVLPLLNGVEVVDRLIELGVPADRLLAGLTAISAARVGPGVVERRSAIQRVILGEADHAPGERAEGIASAFREAGVDAFVAEDIAVETWRKFAFIASMAAACGLARSPLGTVRATALGRLLIERAVGEAVAVARALEVAMPADEEAGILRFFNGLPGAMKPSFLLDLESGGPTEIDDLSGAVARLGRRAGVPTPIHDTATAALGGGR